MSDVERSQHVGGEAESGGHLDEYLDTVEVAVQKVLRFAETTAQDLASTAEGDHDAEYYLRMIFARGAYLHPLPMDAAGPLGATPQADALGELYSTLPGAFRTDWFGNHVAEDARLRREFTEEFTGLTGERKRILLDMLVTHSASTWEDLAIRSPPSGHAEELDNTLKLIKGLVSLWCGRIFFCGAQQQFPRSYSSNADVVSMALSASSGTMRHTKCAPDGSSLAPISTNTCPTSLENGIQV